MMDPIAYLRDAQPDAEEPAYFVCIRGDSGAFPVYTEDAIEAARTQEDTPQRSCHPIPSDELVEAARIAEQVIDRVLDMDEKALNSLEAVRNRLRTALSLPRKTEAEIRADEREKVVAEVVTESLFDGIEAVCGMLEATVGDLTHDEREDLKVCRDFLRSHTQGEG